MKEPVVVDSTCLIALERIRLLEILSALFDPVLVPPEVEREFGLLEPWLKVEIPSDRSLVRALKILVDDGEAEVIALASERGYRAILDDRQARWVARNMGLPIIGTVGIFVKAKHVGIRTEIKPLLEDLERNGFYINGNLKAEALRLAGE